MDTSWRTTSYASDGTFAIALWFTKGSACLAGLGSNSFATLFSHMQVPDDESKSMVKIQFGCDSASEQSTVTTDGDLIRVWLTDADSNRAVFDVSMTAARGWLRHDEWVHIILAVSSTSVQVFLDGSLVNTPSRSRTALRAAAWPTTAALASAGFLRRLRVLVNHSAEQSVRARGSGIFHC